MVIMEIKRIKILCVSIGLLAQSGRLLMKESEGSVRNQLKELAAKNEKGKQLENRYEKKNDTVLSRKYFWAAGIVIVMFFCWGCNRFRR